MKGTTVKYKSVITVYFNDEVISSIDIKHDDLNKQYGFGRALDNDITVNSPIVSSHHAIFEVKDDKCFIKDNSSTNGIYINNKRVNECVLNNGDQIRVDSVENTHEKGVVLIYSLVEDNSDERWVDYSLEGKEIATIGRDIKNDISVIHSTISKKHAQIVKNGSGYVLEDLGSTNGTYVNGELIKGKYQLKDSDVIIIGNTKLVFKGKVITYNVISRGLKLEAKHISKVVKDTDKSGEKKILDDISIVIKPGELVALIGGSGAGKSTFMDSLNGFRLPTDGKVFLNDDDFYGNYNAYKNILGYVPQQDIVYDTLTVEQMLIYAAKLRMPEDSTEEEIKERVREVIKDVELEGRESLLIKQLSGGQKKRASIAVELLADPKLFYLDEPTSGLDPGMERNLMRLLRKLADKGKTIILITHATANLNLCDKVVILGFGGRLCYFGGPKGALGFFQVDDYADIYDLITKDAPYWQDKYRKSDYFTYEKHISTDKPKKNEKSPQAKRSGLKQFKILSARYTKLTFMDKQRVLMLIAQAPLVGFLLSLVAKKNSFSYYENSKEIIFTLACAGVWLGVLNSIQEVCKERPIYKRERAVNLKLVPYIFSKLVVLGTMCLIQSILLMLVISATITLPSSSLMGNLRIELFITVFFITFSSMTMGLGISTLVSNTDRAMGLAPIILIPQLLFTGLVFELNNAANIVASFAISKWGSRALAISFALNDKPLKLQADNPKLPVPPRDLPSYFNHELILLEKNWAILLGFSVVCVIAALVLLKMQDEQ